MGFEQNVRIFTKPHEAIFPIELSKYYPYPERQEFKGLSVETIFVHFADGSSMIELQFPKGMRNFSRSTGTPLVRRYDAGIRLPKAKGIHALNFHLSYDISHGVIDGYVDYFPTPEATKISHIEVSYLVTFGPKKD